MQPGEKVKVWVYLKTNGKLVDEQPHLIETRVTNGWSTWFSRDIRMAICGKKRKHREGWRAAHVSPIKNLPENPCQECYNMSLCYELGE